MAVIWLPVVWQACHRFFPRVLCENGVLACDCFAADQ